MKRKYVSISAVFSVDSSLRSSKEIYAYFCHKVIEVIRNFFHYFDDEIF